MSTKFYVCSHCGNIVEKVKDARVPVMCCGKKMEELVPNTVEASVEKHLPAVTQEGGTLIVNVGSVDHPMTAEHYIQWVYVETEAGEQFKYLQPNEAPHVTFTVGEEKVVAVYAYCNLHGLWKVEL